MYYGSWKINDNLTFAVNTHTASTGAATDADAVPGYHVYEDETSTPLITGTMALLNGANTVGYYSEQIALSAANGFEKGKSYNIYISATVGGVNATTNRNFQIEAEVDANTVSDKNSYLISGTITALDGLNNLSSAQAQTAAAAALTAYDPPTQAELVADGDVTQAAIAALNNISTAQVNTEVDTALADYDGPTSAELVTEINSVQTDVAGVQSDTNDIQTRLPAALIGGRMDSHVGFMATGTFTSAVLASDAAGEIAGAVWDEDATTHQTQGTFGQAIGDPGADTDTIFALVNSIQSDTDDIQLRLPGTLVSGRMDSHVSFMATGVVTAAAVATDAIGSAEFAQAAADKVWLSASRSLTTGSSGGATAAEVWSHVTRTLTSAGAGGATAQEVWEYAVRTLTQGAASVIAAVTGDDISVYRGTTWSISLTGLGALTNYDTVFFTVKDYSEQSDADAVLQVYNHLTTGLKRFNGAAPESVANGKVTIDSLALGNITITVQQAETDGAPPGEYEYEVKGIDNDGNVDLKSSGGKFTIVADLTRAITSP